MRDAIRLKHYSIRTEKSYVDWIKRYIFFHDKRHPKDMGSQEIEAFLTHLAVDQRVSASTQNQAFSALLFLYRNVLHKDLEQSIDAIRAKKPKRLPTVMTREEALRVISALSGTHQLMAQLLYGSGLRLMECVRLRVKDTGLIRRHHVNERGLQQAVKKAAKLAGINKPVNCHTFSDTASPPISLKAVMISEQCKNCWGTRM